MIGAEGFSGTRMVLITVAWVLSLVWMAWLAVVAWRWRETAAVQASPGRCGAAADVRTFGCQPVVTAASLSTMGARGLLIPVAKTLQRAFAETPLLHRNRSVSL